MIRDLLTLRHGAARTGYISVTIEELNAIDLEITQLRENQITSKTIQDVADLHRRLENVKAARDIWKSNYETVAEELQECKNGKMRSERLYNR